MLSFFAAIIVFIVSEIMEYSQSYQDSTAAALESLSNKLGTGQGRWYSINVGIFGEINPVVYVMIVFMVVLISFQAPINISKCAAFKRLHCLCVENKKERLNYFAGCALFIETLMAVILLTYCIYEETLPIARCMLSEEMIYFAMAIVSICCLFGYFAGVIFSVCVLRSQ